MAVVKNSRSWQGNPDYSFAREGGFVTSTPRNQRQWTSPGMEFGLIVDGPKGMRFRIGSKRKRERKEGREGRELVLQRRLTGGGVGDELFFSAEKSSS